MYAIYNFKVCILSFIRRYLYIITGIFTCMVLYLFLSYFNYIETITAYENLRSQITSVSGTLAGFLFAGQSILLSLPKSNRFIEALYEQGWFVIIFKTIFLGESFLFTAMILGITGFYKYLWCGCSLLVLLIA